MFAREIPVFLFGMFGGFAVNIARWLMASLAPERHRIIFDQAYWLQFFGLTLFGGVVAIARDMSFPSSPLTPIDSMYLGLSLPVILKPVAEQLLGFAKEKNPAKD